MNRLFEEISGLDTEKINPKTTEIDLLPIENCLELINDEDQIVAKKVREQIPEIKKATEIVIKAFKNGGRLIYLGAGTSGRLGVLDAAECPPTFGSDPQMVQGFIAGGKDAMFIAQEGAEDSKKLAVEDLKTINFSKNDILCGLAASGRTPYVIGGLEFARKIGAKTIFVSTSKSSNKDKTDVFICPEVGPEVVMGSTRMKSGTAQKLVLNMITTTAFVKLGKTFGNIMVDLQMTNQKLRERAKRILMTVTDINYIEAEKKLVESNYHVKSAIVMILLNVDFASAKELLNNSNGFVKKAIEK